MANTSHLHQKAKYLLNDDRAAKRRQTNPRYSNFTQTHFTAGDEEQFERSRDYENGNYRDVSLCHNMFAHRDTGCSWCKYHSIRGDTITNTFRYMFHKFKKGIYVKIHNNTLSVFLPFSKSKYTNEWSGQIKYDGSKYSSMHEFFAYISSMQGYTYHRASTNTDVSKWYANNCIVRYDMDRVYRLPKEGDRNVSAIKHMLEQLCETREVPDVEFFINKRDFPVLTRDGTEPYHNIWDTEDKPLVSHAYDKYAPVLSMVTSSKYADIPIPTYEDWTMIQSSNDIQFPEARDYSQTVNKEWSTKRNTAVFRGSSTGCGVTVATNPRLKLAHLSWLTQPDDNGVPFLDAGITKWNLRPRKIAGQKYLRTIDITSLPFGLVSKLSRTEQSNYKYIVNVDGHVSALRLSFELGMGSVILRVGSQWEIWYTKYLVPYEHFVPVKQDLSDLITQIKWCRANDSKCEQIALNARKFYDTYLQHDGVMDYLQKTLVDVKTMMGGYLYNTSTPLDVNIKHEQDHLDTVYPTTAKGIRCIVAVPSMKRCYDLLRGVQYLVRFIIDKGHFESVARKHSVLFTNKTGCITRYDTANRSFVVKSTSIPTKRLEHIHETFVGIKAMNMLSTQIPNFVFIYGSYESGQTYNVVTEYIKGQSLYAYIKSKAFRFDVFVSILVQISLAIHVAQHACGFVHYDLTPWNIMIKDIGAEKTIDYVVSHDTVVRIKTKVVPVIIDYGKSHVIHEQRHHGFVNMFDVNSVHDVLHVMLTSCRMILAFCFLPKRDLTKLFNLVQFVSNTRFCPNTFKNTHELKRFLQTASTFSSITSSDKHELTTLTPLDFVRHIRRTVACELQMEEVSTAGTVGYACTSDDIGGRQIFEYILSSTLEQRSQTYTDALSRIRARCAAMEDRDGDLIRKYHTVQMMNRTLASMAARFAVHTDNTYQAIKNCHDRLLTQHPPSGDDARNTREHHDLLAVPYNTQTFLKPDEVRDMIRPYQPDDTPMRKNMLMSVLLDSSEFRMITKHRCYYTQPPSTLLAINNFNALSNNSHAKTLRSIAYELYSRNIIAIDNKGGRASPCERQFRTWYAEVVRRVSP